MKRIAILGSTGSIGVSTLDVVAAFPDAFRVVALAAGRNVERLAEQVRRFGPTLVSVATEAEAADLKARLSAPPTVSVEIVCGELGPSAVASHPDVDLVVTAMVGAVGLEPLLELEPGARVEELLKFRNGGCFGYGARRGARRRRV